MHLISRTTALLLTGAALLVTACQEPTSHGEAAVANLDHKGTPHGGGGGGNKPPDPVQKRVTIPTDVHTGVANMLLPDTIAGIFKPYDGGDCGVKARLNLENGFFDFRPVDNALRFGKKKERDARAACEDFPRGAWFDLEAATVHIDNPIDPVDHSLDITLLQYIADGNADPIVHGPDPWVREDDNLKTAKVSNLTAIPDGTTQSRGNGFNLGYCLDDGGRPFRFNSVRNPGSNDLEVAREGEVFHVRTQKSPANVGSCEHTRSDGTVIELFLHMDLAYDIRPIPPTGG